MADRAGTSAVLGLRDFRLMLCGQSVSVLGDRMVAVALAFAVLEVGGSASSVGLCWRARSPRQPASFLDDLRDGWAAFRSRRWSKDCSRCPSRSSRRARTSASWPAGRSCRGRG
jgi:hypothetical protein